MATAFGFRPRLVPTVAAVAGVLLTAMLGNWQLNRAAEKQALQHRMDELARQPAVQLGEQALNALDILYRSVEAKGVFDAAGTVYLDNRMHGGVTGYDIVSPLKIHDGPRRVLVKRGWLPAGASRSQLPPVSTPQAEVTVQGIALPGNPPVFELSSQVRTGQVWQNLTVQRYSDAYGGGLQPFFLQQQNDLGDGLIRQWRRPDVGMDRHRGYAFQWFAMSAAIVILYVVLNVRRAARA